MCSQRLGGCERIPALIGYGRSWPAVLTCGFSRLRRITWTVLREADVADVCTLFQRFRDAELQLVYDFAFGAKSRTEGMGDITSPLFDFPLAALALHGGQQPPIECSLAMAMHATSRLWLFVEEVPWVTVLHSLRLSPSITHATVLGSGVRVDARACTLLRRVQVGRILHNGDVADGESRLEEVLLPEGVRFRRSRSNTAHEVFVTFERVR